MLGMCRIFDHCKFNDDPKNYHFKHDPKNYHFKHDPKNYHFKHDPQHNPSDYSQLVWERRRTNSPSFNA